LTGGMFVDRLVREQQHLISRSVKTAALKIKDH
jgi:hypothetical protein